MPTTIQISDELRKRLKILASYLDATYEQLIEKFLDIYEKEVPFKSEAEFAHWFEENLDFFGFKKVLIKNLHGTPDYIVEDWNGGKVKVEIELIANSFVQHRHKKEDVDVIVAAYSSKQEINDIPVLSGSIIPTNVYSKVKGQKSLMVILPDYLWEKLIKRALKKYGHHGGIKKTVVEALEKLLREG